MIIFTQNGHGRKGFLTASEVDDFNSQYPTLSIKPNPDCHDRFIIIDNRFEDATMVYAVVDKLFEPD